MGMRQLKITKSITNRESQSLEKYLQENGVSATPTEEKKQYLLKKKKYILPSIVSCWMSQDRKK
jgi:RNA polymerase primary sigma factor